MNDSLQLLEPVLIDDHPDWADRIFFLRSALGRELGWHYIVDLIWVMEKLKVYGVMQGNTVVDAGAGNGLLQFLLAYSGFNVISVDFVEKRPPFLARFIFKIGNPVGRHSVFKHDYIRHISQVSRFPNKLKRLPIWLFKSSFSPVKFLTLAEEARTRGKSFGKITRYYADMADMNALKYASVDAVVSISAIEHMDKDNLQPAVAEFKRILKEGAPIILTTSAARKEDWFHKNSRGWCFSLETLETLFQLDLGGKSGFEHYDQILKAYTSSDTLKKNLSSLYYVSDQNGMPWGVWNPTYIPVGITKTNTRPPDRTGRLSG